MVIQKIINAFLSVFLGFNLFGGEVITPYKFTDAEINQAKKDGFSCFDYQIPVSCKFIVPRSEQHAPEIIASY